MKGSAIIICIVFGLILLAVIHVLLPIIQAMAMLIFYALIAVLLAALLIYLITELSRPPNLKKDK